MRSTTDFRVRYVMVIALPSMTLEFVSYSESSLMVLNAFGDSAVTTFFMLRRCWLDGGAAPTLNAKDVIRMNADNSMP